MADTKISALPSATTPVAGTEVLPVVQSGATKQVSIANLTAGRDVTVKGLTATSATDNSVTVQSTGTSNAASLILKSGNGTTSGLYSYVRMINDNTAGQDWRMGIYGDSDVQLYNATGSKLLMRWGTGGDVTLGVGNLVIGTSGKGIDFSAASHAAGMTSELLADYEEGTWTPTITAATGSGYTTAAYFARYTKIGRVVTVSANIQITAAGTAAGVMTISGLPYASASNMNFSGSSYEAVSGVLYATHVNGGASTATVTTTAGLGVVWAYATQYYVTFVYEI